MQKSVVVLDPGHGGLTSFFYDLDNGVRLAYTWDDVEQLDPSEKIYFSPSGLRRWQNGELAVEPRFFFRRKGRRITYGDPGDVSPLNPCICEKDLVLDIARSIQREIGRKLLVKTTRDRDGYVATESRVDIANRVLEKHGAAAILLSLHTDSSNDVEEHGMVLHRTEATPEALVDRLSEELRGHLRQWGLWNGLRVVDHEGELLPDLEMPAVALALGFLSNQTDARRLLDRQIRLDLAGRLARALLRAFATSGATVELPDEAIDPRSLALTLDGSTA